MLNEPNVQHTHEEKPLGFLGRLGEHSICDPYESSQYAETHPPQHQLDERSLHKLWSAGLAVDDLNDAFTQYRIAPLRHVNDIWKLLGYDMMPGGRKPRFTAEQLTSLALPYPDLQHRGQTYDPAYFIRVRFGSPLKRYVTVGGKEQVELQRYAQCVKKSGGGEDATHSEPYFLCRPEMWDRLHDISQPLWITEGELKAISLGLAGKAAIGFGGATMWAAPAKSGKHRIHAALDPNGVRSGSPIPVKGREVYLVPDLDIRANQMVRKSFFWLAAALLSVGSKTPKLVYLPNCQNSGDWKGIDDYLYFHLGPKWSGNEEKVATAQKLLDILAVSHSTSVRLNEVRYPATSVIRGTDRFMERVQQPEQFLIKLTDGINKTPIGWAMYNGSRYVLRDVYRTVGSTSGKFVVHDVEIYKLAQEVYEDGVDLYFQEGGEDMPDEMTVDYPNKLAALADPRLHVVGNDSLIEPFANVEPADKLIRTTDGLINISKFFDTSLQHAWDARGAWYNPPNYRWVSTGCLSVGFGGLLAKPSCPLFMDLIHNAFNGVEEKVRTLQLYLGKIVCNPLFLGLQQFLALYGQPGSGKGTIMRIILDLIGASNVAELRAQLGGRFEAGTLPGKRLVVFHETPDDAGTGAFNKSMAELVKQITGQDRVPCEKKGRDITSHYINADVVIIGETPPSIPMHADAFARRAVFLGMTKKIATRDFHVEETLRRTELPGILWWALEGAHALWRLRKIETPETCQEDLKDITMDVSPVERFINEMIVKKEGMPKPLAFTDVRDAFDDWAIRHNIPRYVAGSSGKRLAYAIRQIFNIESCVFRTVEGVQKRGYEGLALRNNY